MNVFNKKNNVVENIKKR